jgi:hypothetical protein
MEEVLKKAYITVLSGDWFLAVFHPESFCNRMGINRVSGCGIFLWILAGRTNGSQKIKEERIDLTAQAGVVRGPFTEVAGIRHEEYATAGTMGVPDFCAHQG